MQLAKHKHLSISLLGVVCDRNKHQLVEDTLSKHETFFSLVTYGKNTANAKMLNQLGLGETEKAVIFCVLSTEAGLRAMEDVDQKLQFGKPGHGIIFLTKMYYGCYNVPVEFDDANGGSRMQQAAAHNLIFVVLNRGYGDDVMEVARAAGAPGGTLLHARGFGASGLEKFFGVTIAPEREILLILARDEVSCGIMSSIAEKAGPESNAGAISFSLPANAVKGARTVRDE